MLTFVVLSMLFWSGPTITAANISDQSRPLHAGVTDHPNVPGFSFDGQAACDAAGNIYVRPSVGFDDTAIVRLSADGQTQTVYRLLSLSPSTEPPIIFAAFSVTPQGDIWELVEAPDGSRIEVFEFGQEQEAEHRTRLDVPFAVHPQKFAVFENGDVLFTGYYDRRAGTLDGTSYSALFAPNGKVIKTLDDHSHEYTFDPRKLPEGTILRGDDNRIYFLQSNRVLIYSVTGEFLKEVRFEKPDKEFRAFRLDVSEGLLSIEFAKPFQKQTPRGVLHGLAKTYLIVDAADSRVISYYLPDEELGNNCVCFNRKQGYTFFWIENGMIKFVHAPLK